MRIVILLLLIVALHVVPTSLPEAVHPPAPAVRPLALSEADREWIGRHRTIRVSISNPYPPSHLYTGELYQGIAYDYLALACRRLGIALQPLSGLDWEHSLELLRERRGVDLVLSLTRTPERDSFVAYTRPFLRSPQVIFTRKDGRFISGVSQLAGRVVAVERDRQIGRELARDVPGIRFLEVENSARALRAVSKGEADAFVQSLALGSYHIEKSGLANLKVAAPAPYPDDELAMGVRSDWPELARLIDRALSSLSREEHEAIRSRWLTLRYEHGIRKMDVAKWAALVASLALLWIWLLRRTVRARTAALEAEVQLRSRREHELEREKRLVDQVIESLPEIFYLHDCHRFLRWNSAFGKVMGLSDQELAAVSPLSLVHEEDRALSSRISSEILEGGEARWEVRVLTKSGVRHHLITGRRMELDGAFYVVGTASDVTEQKIAQGALKESERRFSEMLENLRLIAIIFDTEDRLTFCNDFLLELTGWQRSEVLGRNWFETFYPDAAESQRTFHERLGAGVGYLHRERTILTHDGVRRVISWNSTVLRNPQGEDIGVASIGEDITDRRQYENALHNISAGVSAATGAAVFQSLVSHLAQALEVDYAIIGELHQDGGGRVTTVAVSAKGAGEENFSYSLKGTPCESLAAQGLVIIDKGVRSLYPEFGALADIEVESFAGVPLICASGEFLGVLTVLSSAPFANRELVEAMLGIFAVRAAAEMQRTKAEQALKESEEKYRLLFDRMLNGYAVSELICDPRGRPVDYRYLEVNASFERLTGLKREQLIGRSVRELMPQTEEIWIERFGAVALSEQPDQFEHFSADLNKWLKVAVYSPQRGQFAVTYSDITQRKLAERALRESEEHVREIFDQNEDGVVLFRMDTFEIMDANPAALQLYGASKDDFKQLKPWTFISPSDFRKLIKMIPRDNKLSAFQLERSINFRKDGSKFVASIRGKILTLRNEYVILCSVRDITEQARLEDEMKATQAKLIQTNKMTSLGYLVSGVAHEINNPNNFISVNAMMLAEAWQDATPILREFRDRHGDFSLGGLPFSEMESVAPRLFTAIGEGSSRITRIVSDMRNFVTKDERGDGGAIDVNRVIENAASLLWHHIHRYTDSFSMLPEAGLPPGQGNAQQIEQVVINLIMNALQALPGKGCGVRVKSGFDHANDSIVVSVIDEGYGMSKKVLKHLTEPFFSTRIEEGGTGLGLYISSSIIKEHLGTLSFDSAPGKGTTATIRLPRGGGSGAAGGEPG